MPLHRHRSPRCCSRRPRRIRTVYSRRCRSPPAKKKLFFFFLFLVSYSLLVHETSAAATAIAADGNKSAAH